MVIMFFFFGYQKWWAYEADRLVLDDDEVAAVLTYIRNSWGGSAQAVAPEQVSKVRLDTATRPD
jgi:hypothetical protein